jgi:streptogramin lyase
VSNGPPNRYLAARTKRRGECHVTEFNANRIGFMTTLGVFDEKIIPQANTGPTGIALGPDNKIWFTEGTAGAVNTLDEVRSFGTPVTGFSGPNQIVGGADGRIWFTAQSGGKIEALAAAKNAPASEELVAGSGPLGITLAPGGELFYVLDTDNQLCECIPGYSCGCYSTPSLTPASGLRRIVTDRSGQRLWFTERSANKIGTAFAETGTGLVEYTVPTAASAPLGITAGPDGNIWFTEQLGNKIGRITPAGVIT